MSSQQTDSIVKDESYNGYEYTIVRFSPTNYGIMEEIFMSIDNSPVNSWYLGYVILPEGHEYHGKDYEDIPIDCHGGLTYGDTLHWESKNKGKFAIGLDMNHYSDNGGSEEQMRQECKKIIDQLTS
jgi:hypothetical protein